MKIIENIGILDDDAVKKINYFKSVNPNEKVIIKIPNTKGIDEECLKLLDDSISIRIEGQFNDEFLGRYDLNRCFDEGDSYKYVFVDCSTYSAEEVYRFIKFFKAIEKNDIMKLGNPMIKAAYIYDILRKNIKYEPAFEELDSKETRSLRGIISRNTVCAGYSIIYKELCDRNNIKCDFAWGWGHAWNLLHFNGKVFPLDLTYDTSLLNNGKNKLNYFCKLTDNFISSHRPNTKEPIQDYSNTLSSINKESIDAISNILSRVNCAVTNFHRYEITETDIPYIGHVHYDEKTGNNIYFCASVDKDDSKRIVAQGLFVTSFNLSAMTERIRKGKKLDHGISTAMKKIFCKSNLDDSANRKTAHIGDIFKNGNYYDVSQKEKIDIKFRSYRRSDGTSLIVHYVGEKDATLNKYITYEVNLQSKTLIKQNVFTDMDLLNIPDKRIIDKFLSSDRISDACINRGGYLGYYKNGKVYEDLLYTAIGSRAKDSITANVDSELDLSSTLAFEDVFAVGKRYISTRDDSGEKFFYDKVNNRKVSNLGEMEKVIFGLSFYEQIVNQDICCDEHGKNTYNSICNMMYNQLYNTGLINHEEIVRDLKNNGINNWASAIKGLFCNSLAIDSTEGYFMRRVNNDTIKGSIKEKSVDFK